jgi:lipoprotein NlpI
MHYKCPNPGRVRAKSELRTISMMSLPAKLCVAIAGTAVVLSGCVHTPPGTSVEVALAKKPELVRLPESPKIADKRESSKVAPVEPTLPADNKTEKIADAYTRGGFCMEAGKDQEAIAAFQEAVALDPTFTDAWQNLAVLYEKSGDQKRALEAFRRSKKIARQ